MKHKTLLCAFTLVTLFACAFGLSACDSDWLENIFGSSGEEKHTHSYTSEVTTAATCTTAGVTTYTCSCGDSYTETIPVAEHTPVSANNGVAATCTAAGKESDTICSVCQETLSTGAVIPVLAHTPAEAVKENEKAASCTKDGSYDSVIYCSVCKTEISRETVIIPAGHTWNGGEMTIEATCTEAGVKTYICTACNVTKSETVAALGHNYVNGICARCGAERVSENLAYTLSADGAFYIVSGIGTCTDTDIVIPATYNNLPVTSIGEWAFYKCTSLTSLTIGNDITSIGDCAFCGCTALTEINYNAAECANLSSNNFDSSNKVFAYAGQNGDGITVTIGANVKKIPAYLFYSYYNNSSNSPKIVSVLFAENSQCTSIGYEAFSYCTSLTSIVIPDSVTEIGYEAFRGCSSLTSIVIPDSVTYIGGAFSGCTSLTSVTIGNGVTTISDYAFSNCTSLTSIVIPDSVTSIGYDVFYGCTALTEINYNATECADLSSSNEVFSYAGQSGDGITVTIGANVKKIPAYLFCPYSSSSSYSPKIVSVIFAENSQCTSIGGYAFAYCTSLVSITIPDSVTSIGRSAFCNCTALTEINYNATECADLSSGNDVFYKAGQSGDGITVTIGANVTKIPAYLFCSYYNNSSNSPKIVSVTIGSGVTSIGNYAFSGCTSLTEINYNATECAGLGYNNNYVFYKAGQSGEGITVTIGANVKKIPAYLFCPYSDSSYYYSPKIVGVVFAENSQCTSIGSYAFYNCKSLTSITIPDSVTEIGIGAFQSCISLRSVTIGNGVTSIGDSAFYGCSKLTSVTFRNTSGWRCFWSSTATSGTSISSSSLANASTAAKYLTDTYCGYYWKRS